MPPQGLWLTVSCGAPEMGLEVALELGGLVGGHVELVVDCVECVPGDGEDAL